MKTKVICPQCKGEIDYHISKQLSCPHCQFEIVFNHYKLLRVIDIILLGLIAVFVSSVSVDLFFRFRIEVTGGVVLAVILSLTLIIDAFLQKLIIPILFNKLYSNKASKNE